MLGLDWSELAVIAMVALVVIGPKDLPGAIRGLAQGVQKLRRMAGEFQGHLDEVVREAKLDEIRNQINEVRNFDIKGEMERAVDSDGSLRKTFSEDPLNPATPPPTPSPPVETATVSAEPAPPAAEASAEPPPGPPEPPEFIPPEAVRAAEAQKPPANPAS
jgi:sec-independent protein translocase protein TatB